MSRRRRAFATLALACGLALAAAAFADDPDFPDIGAVNEGRLVFLAKLPDKPVHHHQNRIRIEPSSLVTGWVELEQCHEHLDAVGNAQITFRDGFVRDLRITEKSAIGDAWISDASVQLRAVEHGARLCIAAQTRALKAAGNGYFNLANGPYMRKFLDGYYPMRVSLDIRYPNALLKLVDVSPPPQPGFAVSEEPGRVAIDARFEGELRTLLQFERR